MGFFHVVAGDGLVVPGGVYDTRFLRPSEQGLRARLNGVLLSFGWLVGFGWVVFCVLMLWGVRGIGMPRSRKRFTCCASWGWRG